MSSIGKIRNGKYEEFANNSGGMSKKDVQDATIAFEESAERENINSGETLTVLFGKIKKYFSSLKNIAFTGDYKDIHNAPDPTAVKGDKESSYRTGDVNLTCENIGAIPTEKIVKNTNITEAGFLMDGKTASSELNKLNSKLTNYSTYSTSEIQVGAMQDGSPVYRKIVKTPMTNFTKPTSGYQSVSVGLGVIIKDLLSFNVFAFSGSTFYPMPYSGDGHYGTWLQSFAKTGTQTSMRLSNNVAWGASYTLVALIEYTK